MNCAYLVEDSGPDLMETIFIALRVLSSYETPVICCSNYDELVESLCRYAGQQIWCCLRRQLLSRQVLTIFGKSKDPGIALHDFHWTSILISTGSGQCNGSNFQQNVRSHDM